jgi:hypothetical protein
VETADGLDRGWDWGAGPNAWRNQDKRPGRPEAQFPGTVPGGGVLRSDSRGSVKVLCSLSRVVAGSRLDLPTYNRPNSSVRDLPGVPIVVRRRRPSRLTVLVAGFESEWVVFLFVRWSSDIQQWGLMWRLPRRERAGVQTIGTDRLLRKSSFSPTEVAQWLIDHDNHPWDKTSMSYHVRRPTHDTPAEVETINSFVRRYPADRVFMNTSIALDEDLPMPLPADEASDEEVLASGGSMTRGNHSTAKPQPRLSSRPACSVKIPRSVPLQDPRMSAYDSMDADPNLATAALRGSSAELPTSLVTRMQAEGHLSLLEYYARAYHQANEGGYAPITEAVLVFAMTGIREDARRARVDKEAVRYELENAANRVDDLLTRLQCSELTASALLDSLQRSQDASPVARKHSRYE